MSYLGINVNTMLGYDIAIRNLLLIPLAGFG
jgi:hypothetical protein